MTGTGKSVCGFSEMMSRWRLASEELAASISFWTLRFHDPKHERSFQNLTALSSLKNQLAIIAVGIIGNFAFIGFDVSGTFSSCFLKFSKFS